MNTVSLYDALEICLQALEQGSDIEACLARFPAQADELRPILETALQARSIAVAEVSETALRRGRARVLQAAAELREQNSASVPNRRWKPARIFSLALVSAAVMFCLLVSTGTGLVNAAADSLPGDGLYPIKRAWENIRLFISAPKARLELETQFKDERVREINHLFLAGRAEQVEFEGVVTTQTVPYWNISGLQVLVTDQAQIEGEVLPGARVVVWGQTNAGFVLAKKIRLLTPPLVTPTPLSSPNPPPILTPTPRLTETQVIPSPTATIQQTASPQPTLTQTPRVGLPAPTSLPADTDDGDDDQDSNENDNEDD